MAKIGKRIPLKICAVGVDDESEAREAGKVVIQQWQDTKDQLDAHNEITIELLSDGSPFMLALK